MSAVIAPPPGFDVTRPSRDIALAHPLVQQRWPVLKAKLEARGIPMFLNEAYRYDARQKWLFGAGRTGDECARYGVPRAYARPKEARVTNAYSCGTSAHGWTRVDERGILVPAAAAIDVVPVGADGKPWTKDDDWKGFLAALVEDGYAVGLVHFHKPGAPPTDKPHLQLREWSDKVFKVILPPGS